MDVTRPDVTRRPSSRDIARGIAASLTRRACVSDIRHAAARIVVLGGAWRRQLRRRRYESLIPKLQVRSEPSQFSQHRRSATGDRGFAGLPTQHSPMTGCSEGVTVMQRPRTKIRSEGAQDWSPAAAVRSAIDRMVAGDGIDCVSTRCPL